MVLLFQITELYSEADILQAADGTVAHTVGEGEMVGAGHRETGIASEVIARVDIATRALAVPLPCRVGKGVLHGVAGNAAVGEGGVDEEEGVTVGVGDTVAHLHKEIVDAVGVGHLDIKARRIGGIPALLVDMHVL